MSHWVYSIKFRTELKQKSSKSSTAAFCFFATKPARMNQLTAGVGIAEKTHYGDYKAICTPSLATPQFRPLNGISVRFKRRITQNFVEGYSFRRHSVGDFYFLRKNNAQPEIWEPRTRNYCKHCVRLFNTLKLIIWIDLSVSNSRRSDTTGERSKRKVANYDLFKKLFVRKRSWQGWYVTQVMIKVEDGEQTWSLRQQHDFQVNESDIVVYVLEIASCVCCRHIL